MFCNKCGKEIEDQAVICPGCGCPTKNYNKPASDSKSVSTGYSSMANSSAAQVARFSAEVKSIWILALLSLIFSLGIGIIFFIIAAIKNKNLPAITSDLTDSRDIAEYESAKLKLKSARTMLGVFSIIFGLCLLIGMIVGAGSAFSY